jgi:hypothetical protein
MSRKFSICVVLVLAAMLCTSANAANLLINGDFALGSNGTTAPDNVALGWSTWNSSGGWNNRETAQNPVPGDYLFAIGAGGGYGAGVYQDVAATVGTNYTLTADSALDNWWMNHGYLKLEFWDAGNVNMVGFAESAHWGQPGYDLGLPWANYSISGVAPAGTVTVRAALASWGEGGTARFDNAVLTPEPATLAILGLGGLLLRRRK